MPHPIHWQRTFFALLVCFATLNAFSLSATAFDGASVVAFHGYDDCIELRNGKVTVVLCPAAGGRVLKYALDDVNVLYLSTEEKGWRSETHPEFRQPSAGRFDIGPEKTVQRGTVLWSGAWKGKIVGHRKAILTSQYDPQSGVRLVRTFHLHESTSQLRCTQEIINESKERVSLCHWSRTFAVGGGVAVFPRSPRARFPEGYVMYDGGNLIQLNPKDDNIQVTKDSVIVTGPPSRPKLGFDSHGGWMAYLAPTNQLFVKRYKTYPDRTYNEVAGLTGSLWYPKRDMVELEPIGPAEDLKPGERASFTEQWWLLPHPFPQDTQKVSYKEILKKVGRKTTAEGKESGKLISPEVRPDRRVTFRFAGEDASFVNVVVDYKSHPMERDADGIWKTTLGPIKPGVHEYTFDINGVRVTDPRNRWTKKWFQCASLFEVLGDSPSLTEQRDVPHGTVHRHFYASKTSGGQRTAIVYTPPGYDLRAPKPYPVLVLCHGFGDDESAWTEVGRAHHIMDNLIAGGKIDPMVVVMPNGHPLPPQLRTWSEDYNAKNGKMLVDDVINDLLPLVQRHYHIAKDPQRRAITGLSMGGGHSILAAMEHPEQFGWVGAFSAAAPEGRFAEEHQEWIERADKSYAQRQLFWIGCGVNDFLLERNRDFVDQLKQHGIAHQYVETEGYHSWDVWRSYFPTFAQLLFQTDE